MPTRARRREDTTARVLEIGRQHLAQHGAAGLSLRAVTRDGTFLIEDGVVARPVRDLRLTDSLLGILSRVEALTAAQKLATAGEFYGRRFAYGVVCPALRVGSVRFTGATG